MARTQQGSNESAKTSEKDKKRSWSAEEEDVLLASLKDLIVQGWKSDNGFKKGYVNRLEDAMRKAFPSAGIKGHPHVESKLTCWKRTYSQLMTILGTSGVGFNLKGDNKIDCDNEVWAEATKTDSKTRNWRSRSWPLLEGWKEVFGKDRATGDGAKDLMGMVNQLIHDHEGNLPSQQASQQPPHQPPHQPSQQPSQENENNYINLEDEIPPPTAEDSSCQSTYENAKAPKNAKKRKAEDNIEALIELVGDIHKNSSAKYEMFSSTLGYQAVLNKTKTNMWPLLQRIPNLSEDDMFDLGEKLLKFPERLEFFAGLPEEARPAYVARLMKTAL